MSESSAFAEFLANTWLRSVLLTSVDAERLSKGAIAIGNNEAGDWTFDVRHQVSSDGKEFTVEIISKAESSTVSIELQHQLQYDFVEPVHEVNPDVVTRFLGESAIVTVAPYIREIVHTTGMRMQCDVPWLSIIGPQSMTPGGQA